LHVTVAGERHGRDDQGGGVRKVQSPAPGAGPAHSRGEVQRRAGAIPGHRTLYTHDGGAQQLHISDAQRPHGRVGNYRGASLLLLNRY